MARYQQINPGSPAGLISAAFGTHTPAYRKDGEYGESATTEQQLSAINELRRRLDEQEHQLAFRMKLAGATWDEIADTFGLNSRQRAQQKFGPSAGLLDRLEEAKKHRRPVT